MELPRRRPYTIEDIYALPDGARAELVDGELYRMAAPNTEHQRLVRKFTVALENHIRSKGGACEVFQAPFAVFLRADESVYLEPDVSVVCDRNKLDDDGCKGAPDFIVEIVSPSSRRMDYAVKNTLYADAGVREYWIVDPLKGRTTVYRYEEDVAPVIFPFGQEIAVGIFEDFGICVSDMP